MMIFGVENPLKIAFFKTFFLDSVKQVFRGQNLIVYCLNWLAKYAERPLQQHRNNPKFEIKKLNKKHVIKSVIIKGTKKKRL
jgi:hypothetical protein